MRLRQLFHWVARPIRDAASHGSHATATDAYSRWVRKYDTLTPEDKRSIDRILGRLECVPAISVIVNVRRGEEELALSTLRDLSAQIYRASHVHLVLDEHAAPRDRRKLFDSARRDLRLDVVWPSSPDRSLNQSSQGSVTIKGDFAIVVDAGDRLPVHALATFAIESARHPEATLLYADEDIVTADGRRTSPRFKPKWNPDLFLSENYIGRPFMARTSAVRRVGGVPRMHCPEAEYDFLLRLVEITAPECIRHVPFILYHRHPRQAAGMTTGAGQAAAEVAALNAHFSRTNKNAAAAVLPNGSRVIRWHVPDPEPLVSLVVPTRDRVELLRTCIEGFRHETAYKHLEIIIADNDSREPETKAYLASLANDARVKVIACPGPFNFAALNNRAASVARGELIGFMNNDLKVIEPGWLREMVSHALRPEVGAVGALLFYADGSVQHAGIVLGIGGIASHIHKGLPQAASGYFGRVTTVQNVSAVTAACLLMKRDLFLAIGGMDERSLAVAYNDVDLCLRLRQEGHLIVFTPVARLYHLESASRGRDQDPARRARLDREKEVMKNRWGTILVTDPYYSPNLALNAVDCRLAHPPRVIPPWRSEGQA